MTPSLQRPGEQLAQVRRHVVGRPGQVGADLGGLQRRPGAGQLGRQAQLAHSVDGSAHVGEGVAGEPLDVGDLGAGALRADVDEPVGELGLDGDDGQRVAEDVVQVAGHPGAFLVDHRGGRSPPWRRAGRGCVASRSTSPTPRSRRGAPTGATPSAPCHPGTVRASPSAPRARTPASGSDQRRRQHRDAGDGDVDGGGQAVLVEGEDDDGAQGEQPADDGQRPGLHLSPELALVPVGAGPDERPDVEEAEAGEGAEADPAGHRVARGPAGRGGRGQEDRATPRRPVRPTS